MTESDANGSFGPPPDPAAPLQSADDLSIRLGARTFVGTVHRYVAGEVARDAFDRAHDQRTVGVVAHYYDILTVTLGDALRIAAEALATAASDGPPHLTSADLAAAADAFRALGTAATSPPIDLSGSPTSDFAASVASVMEVLTAVGVSAADFPQELADAVDLAHRDIDEAAAGDFKALPMRIAAKLTAESLLAECDAVAAERIGGDADALAARQAAAPEAVAARLITQAEMIASALTDAARRIVTETGLAEQAAKMAAQAARPDSDSGC